MMEIDDLLSDGGEIPVDPDLFESELMSLDQTLPDQLYLIPIRYRPIFPGIVTPLIISQGRSCGTVPRL